MSSLPAFPPPFCRRFAFAFTLATVLSGCDQKVSEPKDPKTQGESAPKDPKSDIYAKLDADGNGLYDDTERKLMLDALLKECPEMIEAMKSSAEPVVKAATKNQEDFSEKAAETPESQALKLVFDANGDGKVTLQEEALDRDPLSYLVPRRILQSENKIPWAIDLFAEWISTAYLQEDVAAGLIALQTSRGTVPVNAAQEDVTLQPKKSDALGGVEFAADSGQFLTMPGHRDARWNYRWCVFTFRIDANSGTGKDTVLLDLNSGNTSNKSSPKIWFDKGTGLHIQYLGLNKAGVDKRVMTTKNVVADGKTWNVVVCGIRYGQMFASVNGVPLSTEKKQPPRFSGDWPQEITSFIGDQRKQNMAWAYDSLIFGLTEPSEAMVRKMSGWAAHRLGFQANLPQDHPYKNQRPVLDAEDFPARYMHDDKKWTAWGVGLKKNREADRANAGGPRVEPQGFERVFYDDFRANRLKASTSGEGDLWVGPGFNTAVGADALLVTPGRQPDTYPYDAANQLQTLSLVKKGDRWFGSALYTVNDLGHGYTWKGRKVFRIRCMFPKAEQKDLAGGLFPAFWSYAPESMVWRTSNRIEVDYFEFDGKNGTYLNGLSTHYHYPYFKDNIFAKNPGSYQRYKVYGGELKEEKSKIPGGIFVWDGTFHTWEFVIDQDVTYINITIPTAEGQDKWVEIARCPTVATYLEPLDLQLDYALKAKAGVPADESRQDFVVDWIEVLQKTNQLETVPAPFTAKPSLSGTAVAGNSVTCEPNLKEVNDIRYYWFADGYPLTYGPDNSFAITEAEAGKEIRCMVKAVGARDMPEAWSNPLK